MPLVFTLKPYMEFHRGQFWAPYFSIYISMTRFYIIECDITNYADDNTSYNFDFSLDNLISDLDKSTKSLVS